jgi:hypothetical protein
LESKKTPACGKKVFPHYENNREIPILRLSKKTARKKCLGGNLKFLNEFVGISKSW